jgi:arylsulfatase A-like enzyme
MPTNRELPARAWLAAPAWVATGAWLAARAWLVALALFLACGACRSTEVSGPPPNLLLITFETTRADHLGAYGYDRRTSPRIDDLARSGILFERALVVSPRTTPSIASLLTSRSPHEHGVRTLLMPLAPANRTLAEILGESGYTTGAVQTHFRLRAAAGFDQGFQTYHDATAEERSARQACGIARDWIRLAASQDRPWFLWVHLLDPHWTYEPPPSMRSLFGPHDPRPWELYRQLAERQVRNGSVIFENRMPPDEVAAFVDLYDAEIRYADAAMGTLLDLLDELGIGERTVVVFTSDHGESLGEHSYFFEHGDFGTAPEIHVPLVIAAPGLLPAGVRVPWTVPNIDVAPTILELLEIPAEEEFRGASLLALVQSAGAGSAGTGSAGTGSAGTGSAGAGEDRACFGETGKKFHVENRRRQVEGGGGKWRLDQRGSLKLVHEPRASGPPARRLYDLANDPGETRDSAAEHPDAAAPLPGLHRLMVGFAGYVD